MEKVLQQLGSAPLAIFGGGHLGQALAESLLEAGLPRARLLLCHRGSPATRERLAAAGLSDCLADAGETVRQARIILYAVRPQDVHAIAGFPLRPDCLLISLLAGVPVSRLPVSLSPDQRVRVMPSTPDTVRSGRGVAALFPDHAVARDLLETMRLRVFPLQSESDMDVFTVLGPCLPVVLTYLDGVGRCVEDGELLAIAAGWDCSAFPQMLPWVRESHRRHLPRQERERYVTEAATPGGVTEAILSKLRSGAPLAAALEHGVRRSRDLGTSWMPGGGSAAQ